MHADPFIKKNLARLQLDVRYHNYFYRVCKMNFAHPTAPKFSEISTDFGQRGVILTSGDFGSDTEWNSVGIVIFTKDTNECHRNSICR